MQHYQIARKSLYNHYDMSKYDYLDNLQRILYIL